MTRRRTLVRRTRNLADVVLCKVVLELAVGNLQGPDPADAHEGSQDQPEQQDGRQDPPVEGAVEASGLGLVEFHGLCVTPGLKVSNPGTPLFEHLTRQVSNLAHQRSECNGGKRVSRPCLECIRLKRTIRTRHRTGPRPIYPAAAAQIPDRPHGLRAVPYGILLSFHPLPAGREGKRR